MELRKKDNTGNNNTVSLRNPAAPPLSNPTAPVLKNFHSVHPLQMVSTLLVLLPIFHLVFLPTLNTDHRGGRLCAAITEPVTHTVKDTASGHQFLNEQKNKRTK
jgi:hypothetical protein